MRIDSVRKARAVFISFYFFPENNLVRPHTFVSVNVSGTLKYVLKNTSPASQAQNVSLSGIVARDGSGWCGGSGEL